MEEKKRYRVWWEAINGQVSGIVESRFSPDAYIVRLDNGKCSVVHRKSIRKWQELQSE